MPLDLPGGKSPAGHPAFPTVGLGGGSNAQAAGTLVLPNIREATTRATPSELLGRAVDGSDWEPREAGIASHAICSHIHEHEGTAGVRRILGVLALPKKYGPDDWGKLLGDTAAVTALLDRLLHHAHVLKCAPRSWRTQGAHLLASGGGHEVELTGLGRLAEIAGFTGRRIGVHGGRLFRSGTGGQRKSSAHTGPTVI